MGWDYQLVGVPDAIVIRNLRCLAGYRHPRHLVAEVAAALVAAFGRPLPLLAGAVAVGDPVAVHPVLFHLLWRQDLVVDLAVPLHEVSRVRAGRA